MDADDVTLSELAVETANRAKQRKLLQMLAHGELYMSQAARELKIHRSTVYRWLIKWQPLGIISFRTGRLDRKKRYFQLTEKGTALIRIVERNRKPT